MASDIEKLQNLVDELSAEVAELAEAAATNKTEGLGMASISASVVELIAVLRNRKDPEAAKITVNVAPTPIIFDPIVKMVNNTSNYRLEISYDLNDRIQSANIIKIK